MIDLLLLRKKCPSLSLLKSLQRLVCLTKFSVQSLCRRKNAAMKPVENTYLFSSARSWEGRSACPSGGASEGPFLRVINRSDSFFPCLVCSDETLFLSLQAGRRVQRGLCNHIRTGTWPHSMFEKLPVFRGKCGAAPCSASCPCAVRRGERHSFSASAAVRVVWSYLHLCKSLFFWLLLWWTWGKL